MDLLKGKEGNSDLSFLDIGEGETIVLIHGFAGSKLYWEKILPDLSQNHRVIAIDLPGHGQSGMFNENYALEDIAKQIKDLLENLRIDKVTMFGHSLGGYITLAFAENYSGHLKGFSLIHSTANADSAEAKQAREANAKKIPEEGIGSLIKGLSQKLFSPENIDLNADDIKKTIEIGMSTSLKGVISALLAMKERPDRNHVLEETDLPVLLVAGEHDQIIPPEMTFTVDRNNIETHLIKGAGHMSVFEQPAKLATIMSAFLTKIDS